MMMMPAWNCHGQHAPAVFEGYQSVLTHLYDEDDDGVLGVIDRRVGTLEDARLIWCSSLPHAVR